MNVFVAKDILFQKGRGGGGTIYIYVMSMTEQSLGLESFMIVKVGSDNIDPLYNTLVDVTNLFKMKKTLNQSDFIILH